VRNQEENIICFNYNEKKYQTGPKDYFVSYPILGFHVPTLDGGVQTLQWFPSEYLFRYKFNQYCVAMEAFNRPNELLFGGTFMRQNNMIFDVK
jgi:hypothetical protein